MSVRVRFAPSPTGYLHIGGARTALFNWLLARRLGGTFILRIEDTDPTRSRPEYEAQILRSMQWLGLTWDEGPLAGGDYGPYRQSERMDRYDRCIEQLLADGLAYRCNMTSAELDQLREDQRARGEKPRYDRRNRDKNLGPDVGEHVVRLKMPLEGQIVVQDLIKGTVTFDADELDDWILRRSDGAPTYNFVVVVDDHEMAVTHVIRGDDHLNNTPKQQALYTLLGWELPAFAHLPMILGQDGSRLSKRHAATSVDEYKEMGIPAEAIINYLSRLGWAHGEMEEFSTDESAAVFSLEAVNRTGARWDMDKLMWLSQQWLKRLELDDLTRRLADFLPAEQASDPRLPAIIKTLRERSRSLKELAEKSSFYFTPDAELVYDDDAVKKHLKASMGPVLHDLVARLEALPDWDEASLEASVTALLEARELKLSKLAQPIRVSLTGQGVGPGLYETLAALGRDSALARLRRGAALCDARSAS